VSLITIGVRSSPSSHEMYGRLIIKQLMLQQRIHQSGPPRTAIRDLQKNSLLLRAIWAYG
jgi:hypothetical protein